jgi:hypothetical protein
MFEMKKGIMTKKKYKISKGVKKALYVAGAVATGITSALVTISPAITAGTVTIAVAASAAMGGVTFAINWWKNNYKE